MKSFADIPGHLRERIAGGERILLILLDAFGTVFLERYVEHPLIRRLAITELSSQFPSTTTAHVSTLHFGLPVEEHGLYEWSVLEPSLNTIIQPLPFRLAGDDGREGLAGKLDPKRLLEAPTLYESLGVPATVIQPVGLEVSSYSRLACAGATLIGSDELGASVRVFGPISARLAARLADVAVLPFDGRTAWLSTASTSAMRHLGTHGGTSWGETATYLAELHT